MLNCGNVNVIDVSFAGTALKGISGSIDPTTSSGRAFFP
jgi:hypothetical protein